MSCVCHTEADEHKYLHLSCCTGRSGGGEHFCCNGLWAKSHCLTRTAVTCSEIPPHYTQIRLRRRTLGVYMHTDILHDEKLYLLLVGRLLEVCQQHIAQCTGCCYGNHRRGGCVDLQQHKLPCNQQMAAILFCVVFLTL